MKPLVSFVIPAYNEEKTICRTIRSLMVQNMDAYEIIVVDDGSEDATCSAVIEEFNLYPMSYVLPSGCLQHKKILGKWGSNPGCCGIFLLAKENGGKGDALNAGIAFCHGEEVLCMDADCALAPNALNYLLEKLKADKEAVAVGGMVLPISGLANFFLPGARSMKSLLQANQELEYGVAFRIGRFIWDKLGTTFLISGSLGLFRRKLLVKLGGFAVDTVGEDMEIIMRIRRYAAENREPLKIAYAIKAKCYTELPWNLGDFIRQRIRWTVGLTDVLWKYRSMAIKKNCSLPECLTYWYYLLFEKFFPHIELAGILFFRRFGIVRLGIFFWVAAMLLRFALALGGSMPSLKNAFHDSKRKIGSFLKLCILLVSFVTVFHLFHSCIRLAAVTFSWLKKLFSKDKDVSWKSPARE